MELLIASIIFNIVIIPLIIKGIIIENKRKNNPPFFGYKPDYDVEIYLSAVGVFSFICGVLLVIFK